MQNSEVVEAKKSKSLATIFFTIFIDLLGVGILIPVLPQLLANPGSASSLLPVGMSLKTGYVLFGILIALYPLGQFFATPILGQLSDRYGRKPVLMLSILGTALSYIVFAFGIVTKNVPLLFISRFVDGITGGNISVAQAAIADSSAPQDRAKNFGMIGAAFGMGFILGPFIGGKLADHTLVSWFSASTPFFFAALLSFSNLIFIKFFFKETHAERTTKKFEWNQSISNIKKAFTIPGLSSIFTTSFLYQSGFAFFTTFFSIFLIARFGFAEGAIGNYFAYVGIWIAFTQAVIVRYVTSKIDAVQILKVTIFSTSLFLIVQASAYALWQLLIIAPLFAMSNGVTLAHLGALLSRRAPAERQGEILGLGASLGALSQIVPPLVAGLIAAYLRPEAPVFIAAAAILLAGVYFVQKEKK